MSTAINVQLFTATPMFLHSKNTTGSAVGFCFHTGVHEAIGEN